MPSLPLQDRNYSPRNRIGPGLRSRRPGYSTWHPYTSSSRRLPAGDYLVRREEVAVLASSMLLEAKERWLMKHFLARAFWNPPSSECLKSWGGGCSRSPDCLLAKSHPSQRCIIGRLAIVYQISISCAQGTFFHWNLWSLDLLKPLVRSLTWVNFLEPSSWYPSTCLLSNRTFYSLSESCLSAVSPELHSRQLSRCAPPAFSPGWNSSSQFLPRQTDQLFPTSPPPWPLPWLLRRQGVSSGVRQARPTGPPSDYPTRWPPVARLWSAHTPQLPVALWLQSLLERPLPGQEGQTVAVLLRLLIGRNWFQLILHLCPQRRGPCLGSSEFTTAAAMAQQEQPTIVAALATASA